MVQICRAIFDNNGNVKFESANSTGLTLSQTLQDDKRYGTMKPANGKYYTFKVLNEDTEFSKKDAIRAMRYASRRWRIYTKLSKFKLAKPGEIIDFRIEFRTVESDPDKQLTYNTIMYHYYPISNGLNKFRGLCVVNKRFFFTSHGNRVTGQHMIDNGTAAQYPNRKYSTMDFDQVYAHELGHGIGLPHDTEPYSIMSNNYGIMAEYPSMRDQVRSRAKYGTKFMTAFRLMRWLRWLKSASERS